ncbi:unnamed protein product [marine sediment metagenome]|uniref:Uncharacterized protein n=1 Tax=marine sediment metagenome TaxID=412755 RepID=X0Z7C9_9ZZZZ
MGGPEFQKMMKELRAWKKSGKKGPFKAKLKGPKEEVRLGVSEVDVSDFVKEETNRIWNILGKDILYSKKILSRGIERA